MGARRFRIGVALGLAALAGYVAWTMRSEPERREWVTATVERGPLVSTVAATGTVNPVKSVIVGTYVSGPVAAIDVDFNSKVRRGQRIAKIDPRNFVGKVEQARASLADAQAQVRKAEAELALRRSQLGRQEKLATSRVLSVEELDVARSSAKQAEAQLSLAGAEVEKARASLKDAEVNLGYTDIVSPVDGIVVSRNVDVGQTVAATFQTPTLFVIAESLERMQVNAFVGEADIGRVREGQEASFTVDAFPGRAIPAVVRQVRNAPTTVQNVVTYDVVLDVDNRDGTLKPGMTANVRIVTDRVADSLLVPTAALRFRPPSAEEAPPSPAPPAPAGAGRAGRVWRLEGEQPVAVAVVAGLSDETTTAIESGGIAPGDRVVLRLAPQGAAPPSSNPMLPGLGGGSRRGR
ncbi:efflux RND transporter periplasmic adaptor subunit [bacterium]|nr:efflux RND transporter periplasmic adaptor subunit [bacterium]